MYLQARTHYGILEEPVLEALGAVWRAVLGARDLAALDDLYARVIWIPDGDLERLDAAAREYRQIVGAPDPQPHENDGGGRGKRRRERASDGRQGDGDRDGGERSGEGADRAPAVGSLIDALEQAIATAGTDGLQQFDEDIDLQQVLDNAARSDRGQAGRGLVVVAGQASPPDGCRTAVLTDPRSPTRCRARARYANRLRRAMTVGTREIDKRTPGGRFDGRAYARAQAEQSSGRPVTSHPWRVTRQVTAPIQEPHVGLIIDTSGSMAGYEYALGPIAWILTDGLRQAGGRLASALFGNSAELLSDGTRPLALVPGIRTGGGTAFAGDAIELVSEHLEMTQPPPPPVRLCPLRRRVG